MRARANFWIEEQGQVVLSMWRVQLLQAIVETGSISAAAEKMNVSYRRAWDKIHECEERLGVKLVETQIGGVDGGGSQLTSAGQDYVERFHQFTAGLNEVVTERFQTYFQQEHSP